MVPNIPRSILYLLSVLLVSILLSAGCAPEVGDSCITNSDCAAREPLVCDTSVPDGYCTRFDCERNDCPEESVCVDFGVLSACMKRCKKGECANRDAPYTCRDDVGPYEFCYIGDDQL